MLSNIPFNILEKIKSLFQTDGELNGLITEEILNRSMKQCEFIVRRKRLQKQRDLGKPDKLLRLKQKSIEFIPIYSSNGFVVPSFRSRSLSKDEMEHPFIPGNSEFDYPKQPEENAFSVVPQFRYFQRNFEIFSQQRIITKVLSPNVLAMGGSVLACLLPLPDDIMNLHQQLDLYTLLFLPSLPFLLFPPLPFFLSPSRLTCILSYSSLLSFPHLPFPSFLLLLS